MDRTHNRNNAQRPRRGFITIGELIDLDELWFGLKRAEWERNKYADPGTGHYKCPECGWWSTHPIDNHQCYAPQYRDQMPGQRGPAARSQ